MVDTGDIVSIVCINVVKNLKTILYSCTLWTVTGRHMKVFGKAQKQVRLVWLKFDYQIFFADIVNEVILGVYILDYGYGPIIYGFVVDFKNKILGIPQEDVMLSYTEYIRNTNVQLLYLCLRP